MKQTKNLLAAGTILLLLVATFMRITGIAVLAKDGGKFSPSHYSAVSAGSVFFCAILTGAVWCFVVWLDRRGS